MDQGWIKSYRKIMDNHFLMHDDNAYIVFTKLLHLVNKHGELAGGRRQLAKLLNINDRTLYGVLVRLEDQGMIRLESKIRYSIIHIVGWHKYQSTDRGDEVIATDDATLTEQGSFEDSSTEVATTAQPQRNRSSTTAQHSNKNKKENKNTIDAQLLQLLNDKTGRTFRILPRGYKKTLEVFTLEEIAQAFDNMLKSEWHTERMGELKSEYLLRASTIDTFINQTVTANDTDWFARIREASN